VAIARSDLPRAEKTVALVLANYMNGSGESASPGLRRLGAEVGNERGDGPASPKLIVRALKRLNADGWVVSERSKGGSGKLNVYAARIPEAGAHEARVRSETVPSVPETVPSAAANSSLRELEVEAEVDQEVAAAVREAAATKIVERLDRLNVSGDLRERALADADRALAWLELADREALRNPPGYFRSCFDSGEWPSPRIEPPTTLDAKRKSLKNLVEHWADPNYIRQLIDDEWSSLMIDERLELHEYLEHLLEHSNGDGRPATASGGQRYTEQAAR
jgi:hypothetical protein